MMQKTSKLLSFLAIDTRHCWFYQFFQGWYNLKTNKFEYGFNLECIWYNMMGEEIRWGFNPSDFQLEDQVNLTLEETSKGLCLKDDVAFALLIGWMGQYGQTSCFPKSLPQLM